MPSREELKRAAIAEIDRARDELFEFGDDIFRHAELGFKEHRTAKKVADRFGDLGLECREGLALTGVKAIAAGGRAGPQVAVLGELDALIVPIHANAVPETGAAHACGHNGQLTSMLGVGLGLIRSGALGELAGSLALFAVPAEEYVELEYRIGLREQGKIEFLAGKQELIRLGEFDDVDLAIMVHNTPRVEERLLSVSGPNNGMLAKYVRFIGRASHAGGAPHQGVNALNAATLALSGIHFLRETFRDEDSIRVHPIITRGGDVVNIVPDDVRVETFVRGKSLEAYADAGRKVDRALKAGAYAVGATVEITTLPGYAPLENDPKLAAIFKENAIALVGDQNWTEGYPRAGSTDMGDLSLIRPVIHPYAGGARGNPHGSDYLILDREAFYLNPAKAMAATIVDLLHDDAEAANQVIAQSKPRFTKESYLEFMRGLAQSERYEAAS
jgi:amidohydrolase